MKALQAQGFGLRMTPQNSARLRSGGVRSTHQMHTPDECARHKLLDCLGDLALIGCDLRGDIHACNAVGTITTVQLVRDLLVAHPHMNRNLIYQQNRSLEIFDGSGRASTSRFMTFCSNTSCNKDVAMTARISPLSDIAPDARIGDDVTIGPFCVVGPQVTIGDGCQARQPCQHHGPDNDRSKTIASGPAVSSEGNRRTRHTTMATRPSKSAMTISFAKE